MWTVLAVLVFLCVTVWWLSQDTRMPDWDSAFHSIFSFHLQASVAHGNLLKAFTEFNGYPPFGHLIGALGVSVAGRSNHAVILAMNLMFVPVLAGSCYGVGRLINGPRAGLFAAVFALGTPMIVSEAHEAYLDPLQAAAVALSVFAILASRRFERVGIAGLAGAATAFAMLTKQTTPIFLIGLLAVVLLRGGWRNWRGFGAYILVLIALAGPWYLAHLSQLGQLVLAHTANANTAEAGSLGGLYPALLSFKNLTWYFWSAANFQLQAGLLLFFLAGLGFGVRSAWVDRSPSNLYPELLGGVFVSWLGMTLIKHKDPRYDLPALVYIAVLSTSWIASLRLAARRWTTACLLVVVAASFAGVAFGLGGVGYAQRITLPGASTAVPLEGAATLYSTSGWVRGAPETDDGNVLALIKTLRRAGVRSVTLSAERADFNTLALQMMGQEAGIEAHPDPVQRPVASLVLQAPHTGVSAPCQRLRDGTGIYVVVTSETKRPALTHCPP